VVVFVGANEGPHIAVPIAISQMHAVLSSCDRDTVTMRVPSGLKAAASIIGPAIDFSHGVCQRETASAAAGKGSIFRLLNDKSSRTA